MQLEFSKCYFWHNFHWSPAKLYDDIAYHGKSNCLLEYCNKKLASSTWDNTFYLKLFKTFWDLCILGLQFKQDVKAPGPLVANFCSYLLTCDHMGEKLKRQLVWKYTTDLLPQIHPYSLEVYPPTCYKELWNFKFWILPFYLFLFYFILFLLFLLFFYLFMYFFFFGGELFWAFNMRINGEL